MHPCSVLLMPKYDLVHFCRFFDYGQVSGHVQYLSRIIHEMIKYEVQLFD